MKEVFVLFSVVLFSFTIYSQNIGINTTGNNPYASSALDIDMSNKGFLIPRIDLQSLSDATTITSPTTSLLVYNTGTTLTPAGYYYWNGTAWVPFLTNSAATNAGWSLKGNAGTTVGTNFLGTTDAQDFAIYTTNTERIRVLSGGNIGIGTTSPQRLLHVAGVIRSDSHIEDVDGAGSGSFNMISASNLLNIDVGGTGHSTDRIHLGDLATADNHITMLGNTGIGTTAPATKLAVNTTAAPQSASTSTIISNAAEFYGTGDTWIDFYSTANSGKKWTILHNNNTGDPGELLFQSNGTNRVTFLPGGNVGIGTTAPNAKLQVNGATGSNGIRIVHPSAYNSESTNALRIYDAETPTVALQMGADATSNAGYIQAMEPTVNWSTKPLLLQANGGNVGIGTISPSAKLHVKGTNADQLILDNDGSQWTQTYFSNNGTTKAVMAYDNTNNVLMVGGFSSNASFDYVGIRPDGSTDALVVKKTNNNVGIGTTSPAVKLDVNGSILAGNSANTNSHPYLQDQNGFSTTPSYSWWFDSDVGISHPAANNIGIVAGGNEIIRVTSQNTGIGTTSPDQKLHVNGIIRQEGTSDFKFEMIDSETDDWALSTNDDANPNLEGFGIYNIDDATYRLYINDLDGNIGIGNTTPATKLDVTGTIRATVIQATTTGTGAYQYNTTTDMNVPDYVFDYHFDGKAKDNPVYEFMTLEKLEKYVAKNRHLPRVPSRKEINKDGIINTQAFSMLNLEKTEENTLYIIDLNKKLKAQEETIESLKAELEEIKKRLK